MDWWAWAAFVAFLVGVLGVDLFLFHRGEGKVSVREAAWWSAAWLALGLGFTAVVLVWRGSEPAAEYLAGYAIERALSIDNVFVFALLIGFFAVPAADQPRVLLSGVLGALVLRAGFIAGGLALLDAFHWMIYVFGGFLVVTGTRMATHRTEDVHPDRNPVLRAVRRMAPPLVAVLVAVATTDVVFAVDSIPAVFAVTRDPFIVFSSNAMAILGLRALYFLLAGMMSRFRYLQAGLAVVLVLVGGKMLATDVVDVPIWLSLALIAATIGGSLLVSLRRGGGKGPDRRYPPTPAPTSRTSRSIGRGRAPR